MQEEIYIDNLEAIALEQTMIGVRLTIGNTSANLTWTIARALSLDLMKLCFHWFQGELETQFQRQKQALRP